MKKREIKLIVEHLNGWVRATEYFDAMCGRKFIASVFYSKLDRNDISDSLQSLYNSLIDESNSSNEKYEFGVAHEVTSDELHKMIEKLFLQCPFEESEFFTHEIVKVTRNNIVVRIIDFIRMARADNEEQKSFSTTMLRTTGSDTYKGYMFIFPLSKSRSILISAISKITI